MAQRPTSYKQYYDTYIRGGNTAGLSPETVSFYDKESNAPYLKNLRDARTDGQGQALEYGKSFNWDMLIPSAPAPFNRWFPAFEADRIIGSINETEFTIGAHGFRIPTNRIQREIRLSFYDDAKATLEQWMQDWFDSIVTPDYVQTITEAARELRYAQLDNQRKPVFFHILWIVPNGTYNSVRDSASNFLIHVANFSVVSFQKEAA